MPTVLITGANRGLGLEFCRQYAADNWHVIATCRAPSEASALNDLARLYSNLQIEALDVSDFSSIEALAEKLDGTALDVLINNAGVYGDERGGSYQTIDYDQWARTLKINSQAPLKLAVSLLPNLHKGQQKIIAVVTSRMGSIGDNDSGGSYIYRSSKAALNAAMKSLSVDLAPERIGVLILHPGWVKTDMGGVNALIDAEESIAGMRQLIAQYRPEQSGRFLKYDGSELPW